MTTNFETVPALITALRSRESMVYWQIKDLEKAYHRNNDDMNVIEKLEEAFETLDALASVLAE
jgi:hypothetical protein